MSCRHPTTVDLRSLRRKHALTCSTRVDLACVRIDQALPWSTRTDLDYAVTRRRRYAGTPRNAAPAASSTPAVPTIGISTTPVNGSEAVCTTFVPSTLVVGLRVVLVP